MYPKLAAQLVLTMASLVPAGGGAAPRARAQGPTNLFANPGFELGRTGPWRLDTDGKTSALLAVDGKDAFEGRRSALVAIDSVSGWGTQFGQSFEAGTKGKTYTFAVFAKAVAGNPTVDLQIERSAKPWDRAVKSKAFRLSPDKCYLPRL